MNPTALHNPFGQDEHSSRFVVRPRETRAFHTALDAGDLFTSREPGVVTWSPHPTGGELRVEMPVVSGNFDERCTFATSPLRPVSFTRTLHGQNGRALRQEHADFESVIPKLPQATYPETMLPFLLRAHPLDGERRSLYAWICDRFVAKVYYEVHKKHVRVQVPAGRFEATEVVMYPDINDWVKLGSVVTKLIKPFLPKYHMWFSPSAASTADHAAHHQLVRFEGPYGPPGAPEIVLELT